MNTLQIVCDIIREGMGLDKDTVWVFNQRRTIPETKGLFVVVGLVDATPYGVNLHNAGTATEERTVNTKETLSIDLFSYDLSAIERLPELLGVLNSTLSQQRQEEYAFRLASVPQSVINTSEVDGSAYIYRYTVTTVALRAYTNSSAIQYYDTFDPVEVSLDYLPGD